MKTNEHELERMLQHAPRPSAPAGLRQSLRRGIHLQQDEGAAFTGPSGSWLRRWWPALAPGALCLASAAVVMVQQQEIGRLEESNRELSATIAVASTVSTTPARTTPTTDREPEEEYQREIEQLTAQANDLRAVIAELEGLASENRELRAAASTPPPALPEDYQLLEEARLNLSKVQCVNNLKQIGLAAHLWEMNHGSVPLDMLSMSNELNTPVILYCPGDAEHAPAANWSDYTAANTSYHYLTPAPGDSMSEEPNRVLCRCPYHANVCLMDGSVQMLGTNAADRLVQRDGKLYLNIR